MTARFNIDWHRPWLAASLCLGLSLGAAPASAQLDTILQQIGGKNAAELRRAAREVQAAAQRAEREQARSQQAQACEEVAAWLAQTDGIPSEVLARRFGGAGGARGAPADALQIPYEAWLLEDSRFVPMFGQPFDTLDADAGARLQQLRNCKPPRNAAGQATIDNMFFHRVLHPSYQPRYVQGVQAIRAAREQVAAALQELPALGVDDAGLQRLDALKQPSARLSGFLAAQPRAAYQQALSAADQRIAQPVHAERARQAVAQAQGYDGLQTLVQLQREIAGQHAPAAAPSPALAALRARQAQIAQELVSQERARIDALGSGLVGLERGVQWHAEYRSRYAPMADVAVELREMQQHFEQRRGVLLDAAQGEFGARVRQTRSADELQQLVARYLPLETDGRSHPGTAMLTQVAQWRDDLHKRSVLGAQAAAPVPAARSAAPAPAEGRAPAPVQPVAVGGGSGRAGEPTASEMYDLLKARFDRVAGEVRDMAASCQGGFSQNDPGKALLCLTGGLAGMAGGGEAMTITRFEKLGCERASGKPGYVCDYLLATSGGAMNAMGPSMAALAGRGGAGQARFLRTSDGWIAFFGEER